MPSSLESNGVESDLPPLVEASAPLAKDVLGVRFEGAPWRLTQAVFQDRSDDHSEFLQELEWLLHPSEKLLELRGVAFAFENPFEGVGRIFIKRAPLPHAREDKASLDMRVRPSKGGFDVELFDAPLWTALDYSGGALERARVLQDWQRSSHPKTLGHRLPKLLCNTWGDRSRDSRIQESFILMEIEAAKRLGAEVVQIDDGWQKGRTANSAQVKAGGGVWEGFWNSDPEFWTPDPVRFPRGLAPVVDAAKRAGLEIGLWFAPDSWNELANWERDAARLLELHKTFGVRHFKLDSINAKTKPAHDRVALLLAALENGSDGEIVVDFDITAHARPGYFGAVGCGPLFLENRYTDMASYWPHVTLRSLWSLARWVDPSRLRMEFLNVSRNHDKYPDGPLDPKRYSPDALFATTMFANPLGWFEISNLPQSYFEKAAPLIELWKSKRRDIFSGTVLPIGSIPDGVAWTGFASVSPDGKRGLVLIFREANKASSASFSIPSLNCAGAKWKVLAGSGSIASSGDGFVAEIESALGYLFCEFELA